MAKEHLDISVLDNCRISFWAEGAKSDNYVTRAVFTLSGDITPAMPHLSRMIKDSSYNPGSKTLAFRVWDMPVVVKPDTITVNKMQDMATAHKFLDWLKDKIKEE